MPFSDLNDDVLRHIASFLQPSPCDTWRYHLNSRSAMRDREHAPAYTAPPSPPLSPRSLMRKGNDSHGESGPPVSSVVFPECPSPHWRAAPLREHSYRDVRRFRETCRAVRCAVSPPLTFVDIEERDVKRWLRAGGVPELKDTVLGRVKRLRVVGQHHATIASAQTSFSLFLSLLALFPALEILELENPFCAHTSFGLGGDDDLRRNTVQPITIDYPLRKVRILSTECECRVCCVSLPHLLTHHFPELERLKLAAPLNPTRTPLLLRTLGGAGNSLTTLVLKVPDTWSPPLVLQCLAGCSALRELFVAFYDLSRKVDVVARLDTAVFFDALDQFPALGTLDMCLSPQCILGDPPEPEWALGPEDAEISRQKRLREASRALAARGVRKGWWWTRVVDLDYGQLMGYERLAWEARDGGDGEESGGPAIVLVDTPAWLHPMVVRNADGQGTTLPMPDEMWG